MKSDVGSTECPEVKNYIFDGIGKLKNCQVNLHINEDIPPVAQRQRTPFYERRNITKELLELEENDVIERVYGPTPWLSPIVVVPKRRGSQLR